MNVGVEGKEFADATFTVEATRVARFADAVGATGTSVPATFATAAEFTVFPAVVADPEVALDFSRVVHADQEYEFERPLRVGETVTVRSRIAGARSKGGQSFLAIETTLVDAAGSTIVTARATMLERGVG